MLIELKIDNLAVIEQACLVPQPGLCAITGETGAGKSVVLGALGLLLGDRARADLLRAGAIVGAVHGHFDVADLPAVHGVLVQYGLHAPDAPPPDRLALRRTVPAQGPSRATVQGQPVRLQVLRDLAPHLVRIVSQHAQHALVDEAAHLDLLDQLADHGAARAQMAAAHADWRAALARVRALHKALAERESRAAWLDTQLAELRALGLAPGEAAELRAQARCLQHAARIDAGLADALSALDDDDGSASHRVSQALDALAALAPLDPTLDSVVEPLTEAACLLDEAMRLLVRRAATEHDPAAVDAIEDRLGAADRLARRHDCDADALPALVDRLDAERSQLDLLDMHLEQAQTQVDTTLAAALAVAARLSAGRTQASAALAARVGDELERLSMPGARFAVQVHGTVDADNLGATGTDAVCFQLSANPGEPLRPLGRVASGGELSRVLLAIHATLAGTSAPPTLVLDEIDAGLGGVAAHALAGRLDDLSRSGALRQILCVTHAPAVAGRAHAHVRIAKRVVDGRTHSTIDELDADARVRELTRMLSGDRASDGSRSLARELLGARAPASPRARRAG